MKKKKKVIKCSSGDDAMRRDLFPELVNDGVIREDQLDDLYNIKWNDVTPEDAYELVSDEDFVSPTVVREVKYWEGASRVNDGIHYFDGGFIVKLRDGKILKYGFSDGSDYLVHYSTTDPKSSKNLGHIGGSSKVRSTRKVKASRYTCEPKDYVVTIVGQPRKGDVDAREFMVVACDPEEAKETALDLYGDGPIDDIEVQEKGNVRSCNSVRSSTVMKMNRKVVKCSQNMRPARKIQAADFDAQAFKERHLAAQARQKAKKAARAKIEEIKNSEDPLETAFDLLVPSQGKADTVAGELIRAISKIMYRDRNDGDLFYEGYGIETCGDAVAFICDKMPELEDQFEDIARRHIEDDNYTRELEDIADQILDEIYHNSKLAAANTEDMYDFDGENFIKDREWEPKYELDVGIPENLYWHIENGDISETDLAWEIENWDYCRGIGIEVQNGYIAFSDLPRDAYEELSADMYDWLERYGEDLDDEYGRPGEEDEEEYDEEEE